MRGFLQQVARYMLQVGIEAEARGVCPSCGGRRLAERAAHPVDRLVARLPRHRTPVPVAGVRNRLRVLRAERDWSHAGLADRLKVSHQTVNAIENERYDPSLPLAFAIARLFHLRIEDVFTPDDGGRAT